MIKGSEGARARTHKPQTLMQSFSIYKVLLIRSPSASARLHRGASLRLRLAMLRKCRVERYQLPGRCRKARSFRRVGFEPFCFKVFTFRASVASG